MANKIIKLLLLLLLPLFFAYCGTGRQTTDTDRSNVPDTLRFVQQDGAHPDSMEYELIIMDPGFYSWYAGRNLGEGYYTLLYLENWNRQLTIQWNSTLFSGRRGCSPEVYLDYDSNINYGLTLNHELYHYFWYVQDQCRIFSSYPPAWRR